MKNSEKEKRYYKPNKDGRRFKTGDLLQNLIKSNKPEKKINDWEQSSTEVEEIIARITVAKVGAIVFDPLMGTGAYLAGALKLGRRVIGVEINEETFFKERFTIQYHSDREAFPNDDAHPSVSDFRSADV